VAKKSFAAILVLALIASIAGAQSVLGFRLGARYSTWANSINAQVNYKLGIFRIYSRGYFQPNKLNQYSSGLSLTGRNISFDVYAYYVRNDLKLNFSNRLRFKNTEISLYYRAYENFGNVHLTHRFNNGIYITATGGLQKHPMFTNSERRFTGSIEVTLPLEIKFGGGKKQSLSVARSAGPKAGGYEEIPTGTIIGQVIDEGDGPIEGVFIRMEHHSATTDIDGKFIFEDVTAERSYKLKVFKLPIHLYLERDIFEIDLEEGQTFRLLIIALYKNGGES